jgi:endoglucanase
MAQCHLSSKANEITLQIRRMFANRRNNDGYRLVVIAQFWMAVQAGSLPFIGVNIAGAEFAETKIPGSLGSDYFFDDASSFEPYSKYGMNTVRFPILWERIQPQINGALDAAYLALTKKSIAAFSGQKAVILDLHNYGGRNNRQNLVGIAPDVPISALADVWSKLATEFKGCGNCMFGIMNEPINAGQAGNANWPAIWGKASNAAAKAIRAAGATQIITVTQTEYSKFEGLIPNFQSLVDSVQGVDNFLVEVHVYYDQLGNPAEATIDCTSGPEMLKQMGQATDLMRKAGYKAFIGEFATNRKASCNKVAQDLSNFAAANSDVWQGLIAWGGGSHYASVTTDPTSLNFDSPMLSEILGPLAKGGGAGFSLPQAANGTDSDVKTTTSNSVSVSSTGASQNGTDPVNSGTNNTASLMQKADPAKDEKDAKTEQLGTSGQDFTTGQSCPNAPAAATVQSGMNGQNGETGQQGSTGQQGTTGQETTVNGAKQCPQ